MAARLLLLSCVKNLLMPCFRHLSSIICLKVLKCFSSVFLTADKDSDAKYLLGGSIYNDSNGVKKTAMSI